MCDGEWIFGNLQYEKGRASITKDSSIWDVNRNSVGQFTGLKDKNGKEIYDGDVIKTLFPNQKELIVGEVIWADSGFYVGYKQFKDDLYPWVFYKVVKVIGNKFENPELLK